MKILLSTGRRPVADRDRKSWRGENVARAIKAMHHVLVDIEWAAPGEQLGPSIVVDFGPSQLPVSEAVLAISPAAACFISCFTFRAMASAKELEQVVRFVTQANWGLMAGNFEVDVSAGTVRFRSGVAFGHGELTEPVIRSVIGAAMSVIDAHAEALMDVLTRKSSADDAIAAVWRLHDKRDSGDESSA